MLSIPDIIVVALSCGCFSRQMLIDVVVLLCQLQIRFVFESDHWMLSVS
jgi:hypothetical protein